MEIKYDQQLLDEVCELQAKYENAYCYPNNIRWLAFSKNYGEVMDAYFRQDKHYLKELGDTLVSIMMILNEEEGININELIHASLNGTKKAIENELKNKGI